MLSVNFGKTILISCVILCFENTVRGQKDCDLIRQVTLPGLERRSYMSTGMVELSNNGSDHTLHLQYNLYSLIPEEPYLFGILAHGDITVALDTIVVRHTEAHGPGDVQKSDWDPLQPIAVSLPLLTAPDGSASGMSSICMDGIPGNEGRALVLFHSHTIISACIIGYGLEEELDFTTSDGSASTTCTWAAGQLALAWMGGILLGLLVGGTGVAGLLKLLAFRARQATARKMEMQPSVKPFFAGWGTSPAVLLYGLPVLRLESLQIKERVQAAKP
eukprot:jgi/Botrbrau1/16388/Bobra.0231s0004.1